LGWAHVSSGLVLELVRRVRVDLEVLDAAVGTIAHSDLLLARIPGATMVS